MALVIAGTLIAFPAQATVQPVSRSPIDPPPTSAKLPSHSTPITDASENASLRNTLASALSFIAPRTIEKHSLKELSLWGINGVLHLDAAFSTHSISSTHTQVDDTFLLNYHNTLILARTYPHDNTYLAWVDFILAVTHAACSQSQSIRDAGSDAILTAFFDHLFQHIDPYSRYVSPLISHNHEGDALNESASVGLTLIRHHDVSYPVIKDVNVNSPAWEQGISAGLTLTAIDGHDLRHVPLTIIEHWLKGAPDSKVFVALRSSSKDIQTYALTRTHVPAETVFLSYYGRYPVLRITQFSDHTADEISQLISALVSNDTDTTQEGDPENSPQQKPLPGLILDLRGNHGGVLQQSVITAALFLNQGIITTTEGRHPLSNHIWSIQGGDLTNRTPLAVLVDSQTASAAEVLASALADHHRAAVIGSSTYGKGLVQIMGELPNQGQLFVSWGRNIAPLGWPLQTLGVIPQLCTTTLNLSAQLSALRHGHSLQEKLLFQARAQRTPIVLQTAYDLRDQCPGKIGTKTDMDAASRLLSSSPAYQTALKSIPSDLSSAASPF